MNFAYIPEYIEFHVYGWTMEENEWLPFCLKQCFKVDCICRIVNTIPCPYVLRIQNVDCISLGKSIGISVNFTVLKVCFGNHLYKHFYQNKIRKDEMKFSIN